MEDTTQPDPETTYEKEMAGFELFGEPLKPYSPSRRIAAQTMGMLYPFIGELLNGSYPGMLKDAIIVCWLMTLADEVPAKSEAWTPSKAFRRPSEALDVAMTWAIGKGINGPTHEAVSVFVRVVGDVAAAEFSIETEDVGGTDNLGDASGPKV